jgi:hypothetical protein
MDNGNMDLEETRREVVDWTIWLRIWSSGSFQDRLTKRWEIAQLEGLCSMLLIRYDCNKEQLNLNLRR